MTSQSRTIRSHSQKIVKFVKFGPLIHFNCQRACDFTYVSASIYDRKRNARPFATTHDILWCLRFVQSLLKGRSAPIWRTLEPTHMRLSGTDRLNFAFLFIIPCLIIRWDKIEWYYVGLSYIFIFIKAIVQMVQTSLRSKKYSRVAMYLSRG